MIAHISRYAAGKEVSMADLNEDNWVSGPIGGEKVYWLRYDKLPAAGKEIILEICVKA